MTGHEDRKEVRETGRKGCGQLFPENFDLWGSKIHPKFRFDL